MAKTKEPVEESGIASVVVRLTRDEYNRVRAECDRINGSKREVRTFRTADVIRQAIQEHLASVSMEGNGNG